MDKEQGLIYYNELISKFNFDEDQKREIKLGKELTDEVGGETSDTEES